MRVHGMKSTARVIGALGLSAFAQRLEDAGRSNDFETLEAKIDQFLEEYVTLGEKLMPIAAIGSEDTERLMMIDKEELNHFYEMLKKHIENADYDEIDSLGEKLSTYAVPADEKERVEKIVNAISMLEYDDLEGLV